MVLGLYIKISELYKHALEISLHYLLINLMSTVAYLLQVALLETGPIYCAFQVTIPISHTFRYVMHYHVDSRWRVRKGLMYERQYIKSWMHISTSIVVCFLKLGMLSIG